ncbi:hypothetical protein JG687_00006963 [Phytophthora cactorum]|uniref:Uncharacterized protein n=1 Tax=Phytophthora cactorum TaxID=29920 RepID=A0A8T1ULD5_9STRA|nr:hypothetical protein JG687_00006963 [Phytophthora cactorum]
MAKYEKEVPHFLANTITNQASLCWALVDLNIPLNMEIELVGFLEGAKLATKTHIRVEICNDLSDYCSLRFCENLKQPARTHWRTGIWHWSHSILTLSESIIVAVRAVDIRSTNLTFSFFSLIYKNACLNHYCIGAHIFLNI